MEDYQFILQEIQENVLNITKENVKKVLVLYTEKIYNVGDCCVRFDKLRYFRSFFNDPAIHINFTSNQNDKFIDALLKNNPHLDFITAIDWTYIPFEEYDIIICVSYDETRILRYIGEKYKDMILGGQYRPALVSISELILAPLETAKYIFPANEDLADYVSAPRPGELYISADERKWGNQWLKSKGVKENESLFILLDSTLRREKLINITVYFELLSHILNMENVKVLIFDEKSIGKEEFYREWLGPKMDKMIFSKSLTLREDLCLIASDYTRLLLGPCTGLMHCASGIYNNFFNNGMQAADLPLMITYTGQYIGLEKNANFWWGSSPLVNCLLVKKENNKKKMVLLKDLPEEEKNLNNFLPCSEYTAKMLIDFLNKNLRLQFTDVITAS